MFGSLQGDLGEWFVQTLAQGTGSVLHHVTQDMIGCLTQHVRQRFYRSLMLLGDISVAHIHGVARTRQPLHERGHMRHTLCSSFLVQCHPYRPITGPET